MSFLCQHDVWMWSAWWQWLRRVCDEGHLSVWDVVLERLYEPFDGVDEAWYGTYAPDYKNSDVKEDVVPQEVPPLEFQVEEARQEEAQAGPGEAPG